MSQLRPKTQSYSIFKGKAIDVDSSRSLLLLNYDEPGRLRVDDFKSFAPHLEELLLENKEDAVEAAESIPFKKLLTGGIQSIRSLLIEIAFQMGFFEKFGA